MREFEHILFVFESFIQRNDLLSAFEWFNFGILEKVLIAKDQPHEKNKFNAFCHAVYIRPNQL